MSLGNAPMAVSNFKTPEQYFTSEVLPAVDEKPEYIHCRIGRIGLRVGTW